MATIFVFVYLLTTIYLFWCCVICMCILKREVFKYCLEKQERCMQKCCIQTSAYHHQFSSFLHHPRVPSEPSDPHKILLYTVGQVGREEGIRETAVYSKKIFDSISHVSGEAFLHRNMPL